VVELFARERVKQGGEPGVASLPGEPAVQLVRQALGVDRSEQELRQGHLGLSSGTKPGTESWTTGVSLANSERSPLADLLE